MWRAVGVEGSGCGGGWEGGVGCNKCERRWRGYYGGRFSGVCSMRWVYREVGNIHGTFVRICGAGRGRGRVCVSRTGRERKKKNAVRPYLHHIEIVQNFSKQK